MKEIFADTNYWLALLLQDDFLRRRAIAVGKQISSSTNVVTSGYIEIEVLNALSKEPGNVKSLAAWYFNAMRSEQTFVRCSEELIVSATELYLASTDKEWSIVDCTSFVIMHQRKIHSALTYD